MEDQDAQVRQGAVRRHTVRRANAACHAARHPYWPAQEITRITALFKVVELWVDGPVKELIAYIAPNNIHVYSCFTLGRDVGKEAVRVL